MDHDQNADRMNEEASLLARYATGEAEAARVLAAQLTPRVFAHAQRMLGDSAEAEDVTQEALLRLWRMAPEWRAGQARVSTWLYRVTTNLCTDRLRARRRHDPSIEAIADPADPAPRADALMLEKARAEALRTALQDLPDRQRQAVVLRHFDGLSNTEIAEILGTSEEAVESLTARGKRTLAARLAGQRRALGYDDE